MDRFSVSVVGDGTIEEGSEKFNIAFEVGKLLSLEGFILITGGLGGVMEAASQGARDNNGMVVGIVPGTKAETANTYVNIPVATGLGEARNIIVSNSHAIIAIGGGAGTLSEMALGWKQNRLLLGWRGEGWSKKLADKAVDPKPRFTGIKEDRVFGFDTSKQAMEILKQKMKIYYPNWR